MFTVWPVRWSLKLWAWKHVFSEEELSSYGPVLLWNLLSHLTQIVSSESRLDKITVWVIFNQNDEHENMFLTKTSSCLRQAPFFLWKWLILSPESNWGNSYCCMIFCQNLVNSQKKKILKMTPAELLTSNSVGWNWYPMIFPWL